MPGQPDATPASPFSLAMVAALALPGTGRARARRLVAGLSPSACDEAARRAVAAHAGKGRDWEAAWRFATEAAMAARELGLHVLGMLDDAYPDRFRLMPDPPCVVYVMGDPGAASRRNALAVVGTREPTPYGLGVARRSGASLAAAGITVVSGLAAGIDQSAHEGCLSAGGVAVAVMAHGLDSVHPRSATALARGIVATGGCLVSEYPPGAEARPHRFVERDRLQSALSDGVFVVEASLAGGTMHTVRAAQAQGRPVACLAHRPALAGAPQAEANRKLIVGGEATAVGDGAALAAFTAGLAPFGLGLAASPPELSPG